MYLVMLVLQLLIYRVKHIIDTIILISINSLFIINPVLAQIIPDGTVNTKVNLVDEQQRITGGIESGNNLFHSFQEFSPTADFDTYFDNNSNITNIFTRVTGAHPSLINGLIKTNDNASLFILNPQGIIFGTNAKLDIGGSFVTTTAESIIFADGTKFGTQLKHTSPLLTVSIPSGLQYGNSPGTISSNNIETIDLNISPENTIAFLGGNIELQNISIEAFSGNVEIGSVAEGEIINLSLINNRWEFNYDDDTVFNNINISQQSQIDTSGKLGSINLQGENIILNSSTILNSTNENIKEAEKNDSGSGISLLANKDIELDKVILSTQVLTSSLNETPITGKGRNINIVADNINIKGSGITASTLSEGEGGDIIIQAEESLELSGFSSVNFPTLILTGVSEDSDGNGGIIDVDTKKLVIKDGARIDSSTLGTGNAGNIFVNANESISISGDTIIVDFFNQNFKFNSGLVASSGDENVPLEFQNSNLGESGNLIIDTSQLLLENEGRISVSNFGTGNAGNIEIKAEKLLLNNNSQIISTRAFGDEGSITVAGNEIILRDNTSIATTADGNGNGGNITFTAQNIVLFDDSTINANANLGSGGKIAITTQGLFTEDNAEDVITASSQVEGLDGIVTINTPDINSKFEATQTRINTLAGEESIYTGCNLGTDFSANKFSYIGRGGMRKGPFDSLESQEVIADLGLDEDLGQTATRANPNQNSHDNNIEKTSSSIIEATTWIINPQGKVELIAQASNNPLPSGCLFK